MEYHDYSNLDPDTLVTCPFDAVHRVSVRRLVRHLLKCQKNANPNDYVFCKFTNLHVMPRACYDYHIQMCEYRKLVEVQMQSPDKRKVGGNCQLPSTKDSSWTPQTDEDWDEEVKSEGGPVPEYQFSGFTSSTTSLKDTTSSRDYCPQQTRPHSTQPQKKVHFSGQQTKTHPIAQQERQPKGGSSKQYPQHQRVEPLRQPHGVTRNRGTDPPKTVGRGMGVLALPRQPKVSSSTQLSSHQ